MVRAAAVALVLALGAGAAEAADQFDLVCKGKYREDDRGAWRPWEGRYRIDLSAGAWCQGDCSSIARLAEVTAAKLYLRPSTSRAESTDGSSQTFEIDRVTGKLTQFEYRPPMYERGSTWWWQVEADCTPAPYSGMPSARF
mgnify:CR=1 FL=1